MDPGTTDAATPAFTANGTLSSCWRGRISPGLEMATPLFETTVSPKNRFELVNAKARSLTAGDAPWTAVPPGDPRMTLNTPFDCSVTFCCCAQTRMFEPVCVSH